MTKRPYISGRAVFESLPPEEQEEILRGVDQMIADNMPDAIIADDMPAKPAKKVVGLDIRQPSKTSKRKAKQVCRGKLS